MVWKLGADCEERLTSLEDPRSSDLLSPQLCQSLFFLDWIIFKLRRLQKIPNFWSANRSLRYWTLKSQQRSWQFLEELAAWLGFLSRLLLSYYLQQLSSIKFTKKTALALFNQVSRKTQQGSILSLTGLSITTCSFARMDLCLIALPLIPKWTITFLINLLN
jgi:hypothetical protein